MANPNKRRQMIGNEIMAGGTFSRQRRQAIFKNAEQIRGRMIDTAAQPPALPLPPRLNKAPVNAIFNQVAYSLLLVGVMVVVATLSGFINWAFLILGTLAVLSRLNSQLIFSAALISLVLIPLCTSLNKDDLADSFAVMTFYFLTIGLCLAILEERRLAKKAKIVR